MNPKNASAAQEKFEQIDKAIGEINEVVQDNASFADKTAAAADKMTVRSEEMLVNVRKLESIIGTDGRIASRPAPKRTEGQMILPAQPEKEQVLLAHSGNGEVF